VPTHKSERHDGDEGFGWSKVDDSGLWRKKNDGGVNEICCDELQIPTRTHQCAALTSPTTLYPIRA
jgi:hypothetical protein